MAGFSTKEQEKEVKVGLFFTETKTHTRGSFSSYVVLLNDPRTSDLGDLFLIFSQQHKGDGGLNKNSVCSHTRRLKIEPITNSLYTELNIYGSHVGLVMNKEWKKDTAAK